MLQFHTDLYVDKRKTVWTFSMFDDEIIKKYQDGILYNAYNYFGAHHGILLKVEGVYFAVWAPTAAEVSVVGEFNGWKIHLHKLHKRTDGSGIWEGFIPALQENKLYKYCIQDQHGNNVYKADPFALQSELRPATASIIKTLHYNWKDADWMQNRKNNNSLDAPWSIYEVHLGSWMRPVKDDENAFTSYLDLVTRLVPYVKGMGFTHVEFMPVMEFPYDGSWGYQGTGYFAATARFGKPEELMFLIDAFHQNNVGVILDWVPSHFPEDAHGLRLFDGSPTYEYADIRKGFHVDWNSYIFDYARNEVVSFLSSSAHFWLDKFHADGIRVDAVNSIIRLDFSRKEGEWEPNINGGNENLEAITFLQKLNDSVASVFPDVKMIAEEASDWPGITSPTKDGGLGFDMKWMMGWMHDMFTYFKLPVEKRLLKQNDFTFSIMYAFKEKYMLPLSHDEVVHGKSPMLYKMPGNEWEKFANLRLLYSWMYTHPGAKLLFMGDEFGQTSEWNYNSELPWELLEHAPHNGVQECVRTLNNLYAAYPSLHKKQFAPETFEWVHLKKPEQGIMAFFRGSDDDKMLVVLNVTNMPHKNYSLRVPGRGNWQEVFNSDEKKFWGSGKYGNETIKYRKSTAKKTAFTISINIPPFAALVLK